jgi:hypothetical protein
MASGAFEEREKAFEAKWAHDEELRFKVFARRNKLLGLWAAGHMGLMGEDARAYAKEVVAADLAHAGSADVFAKLRRDFDTRGVPVSDRALTHQMQILLETAKIEIDQDLK